MLKARQSEVHNSCVIETVEKRPRGDEKEKQQGGAAGGELQVGWGLAKKAEELTEENLEDENRENPAG